MEEREMAARLDLYHVNKDTPIPLYYQLKTLIKNMIDQNILKVGDMIPTENELCEHLGVSRPTVRQALSDLVADGHLNRMKGKGTFVSKPKIDVRFLQKLESFNAEMQQKGLIPSTYVLELNKIPAIEAVNLKLNLEPDDPLILLSRLRFANGEPVVYVDTHIPYNRFPKLLDKDFTVNSLYGEMESLYDSCVFRVMREIEAVNANRREAELLGIEMGKAICLVKTVAYTNSGTAVEYSVARYRGDRSKFSVELYR